MRVGGYDTSGWAYGMAVSGNYAYVADFDAGLQVIDVSNPINCVRVGGYDTSGFTYGVTVSGNYAYMADGYAGLQVIDVSNPANPHRVGGHGSGYALGVAVSENYAYVAAAERGLVIIDVSNPANCVRVGGFNTSGIAYGVAVSGNYAYVADFMAGLQVIDVSDPTNCVPVDGYGTLGDALGVAVAGNHAYVADGSAGLQVIDVSNPTNCVPPLPLLTTRLPAIAIDVSPAHCLRVGGYKTSASATGVALSGNRIYVADREEGLLVLPSVANVQFTVRVEATPGVLFTVEAASSLSLPIQWTALLTTNVATMPFDFVDFDVKLSDKPHKFYRARQP
jgi:hypothetical protein